MKKVWLIGTVMFLISMGVILFSGTAPAQAGNVLVTSFASWAADPWGTGTPVTLTPNGGKVTITANGSTGETWGGLYDDSTGQKAIGMKATINVTKVSTKTGSVQIGINESLGMIGKQRIQASIMYEANNSKQSRIRWRVRSKDTTVSDASWTVLATGTLADLWVSGFNTGKNMTVSFQRVTEGGIIKGISFNVAGTPYTVTWKPDKTMTAINYHPELFGWADDGSNSIKGVISSVYLIN